MKTFNQYLLLAAVMLVAGAANAQGPTNQGVRATAAPAAPAAPAAANAFTVPTNTTTVNGSPSAYSQDSYITQSSSNNYANVDQVDNRTGTGLTNGSGSSAAIEQTGARNNAYQTQSLDNATSTGGMNARNEMRTTQAGVDNESRQTQAGGYGNTAAITQAAGSSLSSAVQTQTGGNTNSANIVQSKFGTDPNDRNSAVQTQTGSNQKAAIGQQGHSGMAMQTQSNANNSAFAYQGARGAGNVAIQEQSGTNGAARIVQSTNFPQADFDRNYAKQTQGGNLNSADINQRGHDSYAEQMQIGTSNASRITQGLDGTSSNVASASYTTQSGSNNSATVYQH